MSEASDYIKQPSYQTSQGPTAQKKGQDQKSYKVQLTICVLANFRRAPCNSASSVVVEFLSATCYRGGRISKCDVLQRWQWSTFK